MALTALYPLFSTVPVLAVIIALVTVVALCTRNEVRRTTAMEILRMFLRAKEPTKPEDEKPIAPGSIEAKKRQTASEEGQPKGPALDDT